MNIEANLPMAPSQGGGSSSTQPPRSSAFSLFSDENGEAKDKEKDTPKEKEKEAAKDKEAAKGKEAAKDKSKEPEKGPLPKILLAEDNMINVQIAKRFISWAGFPCEVVMDGQLCVDAVKNSGPYDLIFMDCQMPNLDGFVIVPKKNWAKGVRSMHNLIFCFIYISYFFAI